jgi:hypothetical protein
MKWWNSALNAQGSRIVIVIVHPFHVCLHIQWHILVTDSYFGQSISTRGMQNIQRTCNACERHFTVQWLFWLSSYNNLLAWFLEKGTSWFWDRVLFKCPFVTSMVINFIKFQFSFRQWLPHWPLFFLFFPPALKKHGVVSIFSFDKF